MATSLCSAVELPDSPEWETEAVEAAVFTEPLTDWQRRRILIAAAAAAAVGAPVRVLDIRPAGAPPSKWIRKTRLAVRMRSVPRPRNPAPECIEPLQPGAMEGETES